MGSARRRHAQQLLRGLWSQILDGVGNLRRRDVAVPHGRKQIVVTRQVKAAQQLVGVHLLDAKPLELSFQGILAGREVLLVVLLL